MIIDVSTSSPRPWGCFSGHKRIGYVAGVFPTPVGVFPVPSMIKMESRSLPHARGGVS
ncbi:hypothetical protein BMETH_2520_0 [methanotrophic bacterial endosymbiont of Bathymodiolus sp.]|nr:hypothetical protein BMETH_2520_0 [methanotrophic bacterial endosymbiont of Bathymodiolus sp.]